MSPLRYRDEESSANGLLYLATGAVLGLAAGMFVAQKFGGFSAITTRLRERLGHLADGEALDEEDELEDEESETDIDTLEERVLEAFRNDPVLSERAIDIGAIGDGIIELTGWVHEPDESTHAVTLTRGVPGVETVINRIDVRSESDELEENRQRYEAGDDQLASARWEGQQVGTGKRRQGSSAEFDRHADPKPELEERWLSTEQAMQAAAEETENIAERRRTTKKTPKGDRTGGAPVSPTGVPKADHVAAPDSAPDSMRAD